MNENLLKLHKETLNILCTLQVYMSKISSQKENFFLKDEKYFLSFSMMAKIVDVLINTIPRNTKNLNYPIELLIIDKNLSNIKNKINFIKNKI